MGSVTCSYLPTYDIRSEGMADSLRYEADGATPGTTVAPDQNLLSDTVREFKISSNDGTHLLEHSAVRVAEGTTLLLPLL